MVTTGPQNVQLLGLGSKLYPSNMLRMLNIDLTRFLRVQRAKIEKVKERLYWQVEVTLFAVKRMMAINILEVAHETSSKLYQGYPARRGHIFFPFYLV